MREKFHTIWLLNMVFGMGFSSALLITHPSWGLVISFILFTTSAFISGYYVEEALRK